MPWASAKGTRRPRKPLDRKPSVPLEKILNIVAAGAVSDDIVSTLAARLTRLDQEIDEQQQASVKEASGGKSLSGLTRHCWTASTRTPTANWQRRSSVLPEGEEPTEEQLDQVEQEQMTAALKPFHNPKLREAILAAKRSLEQVIDEQTPDELLTAGFDAEALAKAQSMLASFRQFIEDNKDEIEALQVLTAARTAPGCVPARQGTGRKLNQPPFYVDPNHPESLTRLWQAYEVVEPEKVRGKGGKQLVDVIALVRHAIDPITRWRRSV